MPVEVPPVTPVPKSPPVPPGIPLNPEIVLFDIVEFVTFMSVSPVEVPPEPPGSPV